MQKRVALKWAQATERVYPTRDPKGFNCPVEARSRRNSQVIRLPRWKLAKKNAADTGVANKKPLAPGSA
jgi:hypothetical protein